MRRSSSVILIRAQGEHLDSARGVANHPTQSISKAAASTSAELVVTSFGKETLLDPRLRSPSGGGCSLALRWRLRVPDIGFKNSLRRWLRRKAPTKASMAKLRAPELFNRVAKACHEVADDIGAKDEVSLSLSCSSALPSNRSTTSSRSGRPWSRVSAEILAVHHLQRGSDLPFDVLPGSFFSAQRIVELRPQGLGG